MTVIITGFMPFGGQSVNPSWEAVSALDSTIGNHRLEKLLLPVEYGEAARRVLAGENVIGDALYFYAPALSQGLWINANRTYCKTIGCHRFYL